MNSSKPRRPYTLEFKAQAIELLAIGRPVTELAAELCISANLLYSWRNSAQPATRSHPSPPRERHFKKSHGHPRHQTPTQFREMIESIHHQTGHSIRIICQVLEVPRSSFYHTSKPTSTQRTDLTLGLEIEIIFKHHRRRYGYRRIHSDLADKSIVCADSRVRRIMEERKLRAIQPKTYIPKTSDGRADKPSPNLLLGQPLPE